MNQNIGIKTISHGKKPIRLRDFIRVDDYYFSVVAYQNQKHIKCFLRYVPDKKGDRRREDGKRFRKVLHKEAVDYANKNSLEYFNGKIFVVPQKDVQEIFKPEESLSLNQKKKTKTTNSNSNNKTNSKINKSNERCLDKIVSFFSNIPKSEMGVTGSRLIGLEKDDSDIDFVMYGKWWQKGRAKIISGIRKGKISEPDEEMWNYIFEKRKVNLPYQIFLSHERRKYHRAVFVDTYFDLLYVRGYGELYKGAPEEEGLRGEIKTIKAELIDDSLIFDYPSFYPLKHSDIKAVLSFTHTYAGQATAGEEIEARGVMETIKGKNYLIVGTQREVKDEYIVSISHIEKEGLIREYTNWKKNDFD